MMAGEYRALNAHNHAQRYDVFKRTLCVCSAGLLRSPTLAWVLSNPPYNRNTRAAGSYVEYALVPVDEVLLQWADEVVFVNRENFEATMARLGDALLGKKTYVLNVPDRFHFRDARLVEAIHAELVKAGFPQ